MENGFKKTDVGVAFRQNDKKYLADTLATLGFKDKDSRTMFTPADHAFMMAAFGHATIAAENGTLDPDMLDLLIERTFTALNLCDFLRYYMIIRDINPDSVVDYGAIPENVKKACKDNEYGEEIGEAILQMDDDVFDTFVRFVEAETETINFSFTYPILRRIRAGKLLSDTKLAAVMGFSVKRPDTERMMPGIDDLLALGALSALFG